jgi:hypothetical protein
LVTVVVIAVMIGWLFMIVRDAVRSQNLHSRGRNVSGVVVDTRTVDDGDDGSRYYAYASVDDCGCILKVRLADDSYIDGSSIPIRYDPNDHSNAVPLVDRPANDHLASVVLFIIAGVVLGAIQLRAWWRRRRCRALLAAQLEQRSMRFEAWRRQYGDTTKYYLVLYDASCSNANEPFCCVPVTRRSIQRLRDGDVLQLYGAPEHGVVALRAEGTVVLPTADPKPGAWERHNRVG